MAKKSPKTDLQNLPAPAVEFIRLVIKKMRYRRKVRAEVMAELAAHFEDELKDCGNDEEREQRAQRLIEDFGDAKLLAVLMRRAKKRCRPLWRTIVARTFQTAGILILCLVVYIVWFFSGKPVIDTDYVAKANEIVRPVADESLNAAPLYNKAVQLYEEKSSGEISELLRKEYNEAANEQKQLIKQWLEDNDEIFDLVITCTQKPYYWQKYESNDGQAQSILFPNLPYFRQLARALRWRAQFHVEQGLYKEAFDDMMVCYRLGRHLTGDKSLVEQLVGIAIRALSVRTIRGILSDHQIDSALLARLQDDLEQMLTAEDFVLNFKLEKLQTYDGLQRFFTAGPDGHIIPKQLVKLSGVNMNIYPESAFDELLLFFTGLFTEPEAFRNVAYMLFFHPDRQQTLESANAFYDYCQQLALKTPAQARLGKTNTEKKFEELRSDNFLLAVLTPALARVIEIGYRLPADVGGTMTLIALLRYKQDKGAYPESLQELISAGYFDTLPMDPWSDKPLVYKKAGDDFVLYSVGLNFIDDGGEYGKDEKGKLSIWGEEGDAVFWPVFKPEIKQEQ